MTDVLVEKALRFAATADAAGDPEFAFHVTASWADVRAKAKEIHKSGGVRILAHKDGELVGQVQGDSNVYESTIVFVPGSKKTGSWTCGCAWAAYSWGRSGQFRKFEGRRCSHVLALQFEGQARGMFGKDITLDVKTPHWLDLDAVKVPGQFDRDKGRHAAKQNFQVTIQHDSQPTPLRRSFASPDVARKWAREGHESGASTARVVRTSDGTVIWDGPAGIDLPISQWHDWSDQDRHSVNAAHGRGAAGYHEPTNKKDRARFNAMTPEQQDEVLEQSRMFWESPAHPWNVARCWNEAVNKVEGHHAVKVASGFTKTLTGDVPFYHVTRAADLVMQHGFQPSKKGESGPGVYLAGDKPYADSMMKWDPEHMRMLNATVHAGSGMTLLDRTQPGGDEEYRRLQQDASIDKRPLDQVLGEHGYHGVHYISPGNDYAETVIHDPSRISFAAAPKTAAVTSSSRKTADDMTENWPPYLTERPDQYGDPVPVNTSRSNPRGPVMSEADAKAQGWVGPYYHGTTKRRAADIRRGGFRQPRMNNNEMADMGTQEEIDKGQTHRTFFANDPQGAWDHAVGNHGRENSALLKVYLHPDHIETDKGGGFYPSTQVKDVAHAAVIPEHVTPPQYTSEEKQNAALDPSDYYYKPLPGTEQHSASARVAALPYRYEHKMSDSGEHHYVNVYHPETGERLGDMTWHADGDHHVTFISVYDEENRRKGIGTGMWNKARQVDPLVSHNNIPDGQTDAGHAWAQTTSAMNCPADGQELEYDPIDGYQHADGSIGHEDGRTVSDVLQDEGLPMSPHSEGQDLPSALAYSHALEASLGVVAANAERLRGDLAGHGVGQDVLDSIVDGWEALGTAQQAVHAGHAALATQQKLREKLQVAGHADRSFVEDAHPVLDNILGYLETGPGDRDRRDGPLEVPRSPRLSAARAGRPEGSSRAAGSPGQ